MWLCVINFGYGRICSHLDTPELKQWAQRSKCRHLLNRTRGDCSTCRRHPAISVLESRNLRVSKNKSVKNSGIKSYGCRKLDIIIVFLNQNYPQQCVIFAFFYMLIVERMTFSHVIYESQKVFKLLTRVVRPVQTHESGAAQTPWLPHWSDLPPNWHRGFIQSRPVHPIGKFGVKCLIKYPTRHLKIN